MSKIPTFIKDNSILSKPFDKQGEPTILLAILATLLLNKPLKKEELLSKMGEKHLGKTDGYLSKHFAALRKYEIINFDKRYNHRKWSQGDRYQEYMGFILMYFIENDTKAVESMQYHLTPKTKENSLDFIKSPTDDIFNRPNPYLEKKTKNTSKKSKADNYLD